jgi:hypothetical protein
VVIIVVVVIIIIIIIIIIITIIIIIVIVIVIIIVIVIVIVVIVVLVVVIIVILIIIVTVIVVMHLLLRLHHVNIITTSPQILNIGHALLQNGFLTAQFLDFQFQHTDVLQALVILNLSFVEHGLLDLDLLVQQGQLIVSSHQLGSQNVTLTDDLADKTPVQIC